MSLRNFVTFLSGGGGGGSGTVTSVDFAAPAEFVVSGNPITTAGTITLTKANQSANTVYAGPTSGAAAQPTFRALVVADIPAAAAGDVSSNTATSVDSEIALFSGTGGKTIKRATGTGVAHVTSGVLSASAVVLTSEVSGALPLVNGGTGTAAASANAAFNALSPMTAQGDLIYGGTAGAGTRLAKDTNATRVLTNTGSNNDPAWAQVTLTTGVTGTLPIANGGTANTTAAAAFNALSPLTAQGDLLYGGTAGAGTRLAKNTTATRYISNTGSNNDPAWALIDLTNGVTGVLPSANVDTNIRTANIGVMLFNNGSVLATGLASGSLQVDFNCTILQVTLLAQEASGSIVVDLWKDTYANYPPTVADTITASAKPTITTSNKYQDATLTGWTTSITAGDSIRVNIDSVTTLTNVAVILKVRKT